MSYIISNEDIKWYVNEFIKKNGLQDYREDELIQWLYRILNVGYRVHQWNYNNFAVYTLSRICFKQFSCDVLDIEEIFYYYFKRDMKSNVLISLSIVESSDFGACVKGSVESYIDIIMKSIYNLEIIILNEYKYEHMTENYVKYRICAYLGSEITKYFYVEFIDKNFESIIRYVKEVMWLYYKLYKDIGKIMEYYMFSVEGKREREMGIVTGKGDLLLMSRQVFNRINYLDFFVDFKMMEDGRIAVINNYEFYKRWCDLKRLECEGECV